MNLKFLLRHIGDMDKKSPEFFALYEAVSEKYWDIDDPDEYQQAARILQLVANRADVAEVVLLVHVYQLILAMKSEGSGASFGGVEIDGQEYSIRISTSKDSLDKMTEIIRKQIVKEGAP